MRVFALARCPMNGSSLKAEQLVEPVFLLAAGILLVVASRLRPVLESIGARLGAMHVAPVGVHQILYLFGMVLLLLGLVSLILAQGGHSITGALSAEWNAEGQRWRTGIEALRTATSGKNRIGIIAGMLILSFAVRAWFLDQPMRYDESINFLNFVDGAWYRLLLYPKPNNHVLNSIFEKLSCTVFGSGPIGIRLPAFVAGILLVLATSLTARKLAGAAAGFFSMLFLGLNPFLIFFSTNARGYSLLALLVVLIVFVSVDADGRTVNGRWGLASVLSALGMLVMPSMLYAIAGIAVWLALVHAGQTGSWKRTATGLLAPYLASTVLLSLALYTPVILVNGGTQALTSNRFVQPLPPDQFVGGIPAHLAATFADWFRDIPSALTALTVALTLFGLYSAMREGRRALAWLLPAVLLGSLALFAIKRSIPFTRTWIYGLPVLALTADAGWSAIDRRTSGVVRTTLRAAAGAAGLAFACLLVRSGSVAGYADTGHFPQAPEVAGILAKDLSVGDTVCAELPADGTTAYYLWRDLSPSDYQLRPVLNRRFLVHPGGPIGEGAREQPGMTIVHRGDGYVVYDVSNLSGQVDLVARSTCWSPAAQAGANMRGG